MPHNDRTKVCIKDMFETNTACGVFKQFGSIKQRKLWEKLHEKVCEVCRQHSGPYNEIRYSTTIR